MRLPARLRLWPSSPICSIWATIALMSMGPALRIACCSRGPEDRVHPVQPVDDLGAVGAVAQHLPGPSLREHHEVPSCTSSRSS